VGADRLCRAPGSRPALAGDVDTTERLGPDDQATQREAQFLAAAMARQAQVAISQRGQPGVCSNCKAACLPQAVYCDEDCRADFEHRQKVLARQGRAR